MEEALTLRLLETKQTQHNTIMVRTRSGLDTSTMPTVSTSTATTTSHETTTPTKTYTSVRSALLDVNLDWLSVDDTTKANMLALYLNQRTFYYLDGQCTIFSYRDASMTVAQFMNPSLTNVELMAPKTYMPYYSQLMDYQYQTRTKEFDLLSKYLDDYFVANTPTLDTIVVV